MLEYKLSDVICSSDNQVKFSAGIENANFSCEANGPIAWAALVAAVGLTAYAIFQNSRYDNSDDIVLIPTIVDTPVLFDDIDYL